MGFEGKCIRWPCHHLTYLHAHLRNSSYVSIKEFQGYAGIVENLVNENGGLTKIFKSLKNLFKFYLAMAVCCVPQGTWQRFTGLGLEGQIIVPSRIVLIFESS